MVSPSSLEMSSLALLMADGVEVREGLEEGEVVISDVIRFFSPKIGLQSGHSQRKRSWINEDPERFRSRCNVSIVKTLLAEIRHFIVSAFSSLNQLLFHRRGGRWKRCIGAESQKKAGSRSRWHLNGGQIPQQTS